MRKTFAYLALIAVHLAVLPAFAQNTKQAVTIPQNISGAVALAWSSTYTGGYPQGFLVTYNGSFYMSLTSQNTTTPGSASWQNFGGAAPTSIPLVSNPFPVGTGGVVAHELVSIATGSAVLPTGTVYGGIAESTAASGGTVQVDSSGLVPCVFDGASVIGDVAIASTTTPGECHDAGGPSSSVAKEVPVVGIIQTVASGAGSLATVRLHGLGATGAAPSTAQSVQAVPSASVGAANGVASLDSTGKVNTSQERVASVNGKTGVVKLTPYDIGSVAGVVAGTSLIASSTAAAYNVLQNKIPYVLQRGSYCYQPMWLNEYGSSETGGAQYTLESGFEYNGQYWPITFNGSRTVTVAPKAVVIGDPVCIDGTANTMAYVQSLLQKTNQADLTTPWATNYTVGQLTSAYLGGLTADTSGHFDGSEAMVANVTYADGVGNGTTTFTSASAPFTPFNNSGNIIVIGGAQYTFTWVSTTQVTLSGTLATGTGYSFYFLPTDKTLASTIGTSGPGTVAPSALFAQSASTAAVGLVGDSITYGYGAPLATSINYPNQGSWAVQSLSQANVLAGLSNEIITQIPFVNVSVPGDTCANFIVNHYDRFAPLAHVRKVMGDLGINDLNSGTTAASLEACMVTLWNQESARGTAPYYGTLVPRANSTDGFLTLANQTPTSYEAQRVAFNGWMRDGAPYDCSTSLPAATGTTSTTVVRTNYYSNGALTTPASSGSAATCTHPAINGGTFELADAVESSRNSGFWAVDPNVSTVTGCSATAGASPVTLTCTGANFTSAINGRIAALNGAAAGGAASAVGQITYVSATQVTLSTSIGYETSAVAVGTTVSGANLVIDGGAIGSFTAGRCTYGDGIHPSFPCHRRMGSMAAAAPVAQFTF